MTSHLLVKSIGIFALCFLISCADRGEFEFSQDVIRVPSSIGEGLYQTKCSSCHGALETSSKIGRSFNQIKTAIEAGAIVEMNTTTLKSLTDNEIQHIADVLQRPIPPGTSQGLQHVQVIGGRTFLASKFTAIFAGFQNSQVLSIISTFKNNPGFLGGKCPHLELCSASRGNLQQPDADANMHPRASVTRRGFITKACQEILSINAAVTNALASANLNAKSLPNAANIDALFTRMAPTTVYDSASSTGLINLHNSATGVQGLSNFRAWRMVIYALCISPTFESI
jgi:hypothetical protein